jgi:hypothetical protein
MVEVKPSPANFRSAFPFYGTFRGGGSLDPARPCSSVGYRGERYVSAD